MEDVKSIDEVIKIAECLTRREIYKTKVSFVCQKCGVKTENLTILVAPTSSLVGSIQISGRTLETGLFKMQEMMNFDVTKVTYAAGITPITPVDPDSLKAMGKTNDAIIFGGRAYFYIEPDEGEEE